MSGQRLITTMRMDLSARKPCDIATALLLAILVALVLATHGEYAISNDEGVQQRYGELILAYYASGFSDRALFNFGNLYLYGGLFDVGVTLLAKVLPIELYDLRHLLCAFTGILGIAATWATARLIAGPRAGFIAALMLTLCGAWYGAMFNHTKDIPFAAAMIGATFFLLRIARNLPRPRARDVAMFGLLLGAALGIRVMGLVLPLYAGLAILMRLVQDDDPRAPPPLAFAGRSVLALAPAILLGYVIMVAGWPWAGLDVLNPVRAIFAFSRFHYPIHTLLDGHVYEMADVPRWYVPAYLLIKLPLIIFVGFVLALLFVAVPRLTRPTVPAQARREIALVALTVMFPVISQVIGHGPAFTGLRHFLYVVPALAVLAGFGFDRLLNTMQSWRPWVSVGTGGIIASMLAWNASVLVRLHPYEYLFYNPLVGGLAGATGRYETDYWVAIMPEAISRLESSLAPTEQRAGRNPPSYYVAVCAERTQFENTAHGQLRWTNDWDRADFFISPTHMHCDRMLEGRTIIRIERLGTLIGVVKDRRGIIRAGSADNRLAQKPGELHQLSIDHHGLNRAPTAVIRR